MRACRNCGMGERLDQAPSALLGPAARPAAAQREERVWAIYWTPIDMKRALCLFSLLSMASPLLAQLTADLVKGLEVRNLAGIFTSGRIADIAVDPKNRSTWYIATASGGLWKTTNHGLNFQPVFDDHGSYSLGVRGGGPEEFGRGLAGHRREPGAARHRLRRRRLQEHRRRRNLEERGAAEFGAYRKDHHRSAQFEHSVRGRAGPAVFARRRPGHVQDHRWRRRPGSRCCRSARTPAATDLDFDPRNPDVMYAATYQRRRNTQRDRRGRAGIGDLQDDGRAARTGRS